MHEYALQCQIERLFSDCQVKWVVTGIVLGVATAEAILAA